MHNNCYAELIIIILLCAHNVCDFTVVIRYHGPGKKSTGDWCFEDGFITFKEIAQLYTQYFTGKVLFINSDCSYSGCWVDNCAVYLEEQGVKPCAHSAKERGILISVKTSCRSFEIPHRLYSAIRVFGNDKNTGVVWSYISGWKSAEGQHVKQVNALSIEWKNKSINDQCSLNPEASWTRKVQSDRIYLVRGTDRGHPAWHYVLLVNDEETLKVGLRVKMLACIPSVSMTIWPGIEVRLGRESFKSS